MAKYEASRKAAEWWTKVVETNWNPLIYAFMGDYTNPMLNPVLVDKMRSDLYIARENAISKFKTILEERLDEIAENANGDCLVFTYCKPKKLLGTLSGKEVSLRKREKEPCQLLKDITEKSGVPTWVLPKGITMWFSKERVTVSGEGKPIYAKTNTPQNAPSSKNNDGGKV